MLFDLAPTGPTRGCPEPDAGVRTPELCPYRLSNRWGWGSYARTPSCPTSVQHSPIGAKLMLDPTRIGTILGADAKHSICLDRPVPRPVEAASGGPRP